jgi:hypothetical protein
VGNKQKFWLIGIGMEEQSEMEMASARVVIRWRRRRRRRLQLAPVGDTALYPACGHEADELSLMLEGQESIRKYNTAMHMLVI